jgi:hypothetical protein
MMNCFPLGRSPDGRCVLQADGRPFVWLADTAWELIHRLARDEIRHYLDIRQAQGFTVVQTVALAELDGLRTPTPEGELPFVDLVELALNDGYFAKIDWLLGEAAARGMTLALLPTWGDKVQVWWGEGPAIFAPAAGGARRAHAYGQALADRYRGVPNLVWVLGGDRSPLGHGEHAGEAGPAHAEVWRALAEGIKGRDPDHLMTFHPNGGASSSEAWHGEAWLDFNMIQSGHGHSLIANHIRVRADWEREPAKPTLDGEPCYEGIHIAFDPARGAFTADDVRRAAYQALFAGAFGHTYGANSMWQCYDHRRAAVLHAHQPWREALHLPFAENQARHLRAFLEGLPAGRWPDQAALANDGDDTILALRCQDRLWVYTSQGVPIRLVEPALTSGHWRDPRTGTRTSATVQAGLFPTPSHQDWILETHG